MGGQNDEERQRIKVTTGIQPTQRINSRIQNRIQSRVQNRIDTSYRPQADAASSFQAAGGEVKRGGAPRGRLDDPE